MAVIKGKKLLILGSNAVSCEIVKAAKELGVYTIVTDWNPIEKAPAKQISDEYWNVSLMDYDILVQKIKDRWYHNRFYRFLVITISAHLRVDWTSLLCY